jgi:cytochrome c-type protein NapC
MAPSQEVYGWLSGTIDTPEEFEVHRLEMAERELARFRANDSLECRDRQSYVAMDFSKQSPRAADAYQRILGAGEKTCIDCHTGIAHRPPKIPVQEAAAGREMLLPPADATSVAALLDRTARAERSWPGGHDRRCGR